jgi:3-dehydroquinate synthase
MPHSNRTITLDTPLLVQFRHRVTFTRGVFSVTNPTLRSVLDSPTRGAATEPTTRRMVAFIDSNVLDSHPSLPDDIRNYMACATAANTDRVASTNQTSFPELTLVEAVPGGEQAKQSMSVVDRVVRAVDEHGIDRQSFVMVIGGGAVLDAVGFGASIAHRGVRLIRVPTTTLAQDDAGMAVKNGINLGSKKNFIGSFTLPHAVICDTNFLQSTPDWSWCGGFSEAVKIALLRDPELFNRIERDAAAIARRYMDAATPVIIRSAELHYRHIMSGGDPFETNSARPLDFGHWLAHRLEGMTNGALPHGQAVAIGIAIDTLYSECAGLMPTHEAHRVIAVLRALELPVTHALLDNLDGIVAGLTEFREHLGGRLTITLLRGIGDPLDVHSIDPSTLGAAIKLASRGT